jgi:hypothetical protein
LAPMTKKMFSVKTRESLSRKDYSNILSKRSSSKLEQRVKIQEEKDRKASEECTFKPVTNKNKYKTINPTISSGKQSSLTRSYPKIRKDRSPIDIEFERQKNECYFKPIFTTKKKTLKYETTPITMYNSLKDNS